MNKYQVWTKLPSGNTVSITGLTVDTVAEAWAAHAREYNGVDAGVQVNTDGGYVYTPDTELTAILKATTSRKKY